MKTLNIEQMENIDGSGCSDNANKVIATVALVSGIGSFFGPVGALVFGPTAVVSSILGVACAYSE